MNIWIAKLGLLPFRECTLKSFDALFSKDIQYPSLKRRVAFRYQANGVHYLSISSDQDFSSKTYNFIDSSRTLSAFSGLLVGKRLSVPDYRAAEMLQGKDLRELASSLCGQYAIVQARDGHFECIVDPLGSHKVFYYSSEDGTVYITNHMSLLHLCKRPSRNTEAFVEWIATGELFGYVTEENDVTTLPEHGRLLWSSHKGLQISCYAPLSAFIPPPSSEENELLDDTAQEFKAAARYLGTHHRVALSLSGGYDSRLALGMVSDLDPETVECFTYPDHRNDLRLAKSVAASYGFPHTSIEPSAIPKLRELDEFIRITGLPFPDYKRVFQFVIHEGISSIFQQRLKVSINGLGGDLDLGLAKFGSMEGLSPTEAIAALVKRIIRQDILTPEAHRLVTRRLVDYLEEKYLPLLENSKGPHRLGSMYFHFERFRGLQGYGASQCDLRLNDIFLPFASLSFIRTAFGVSTQALWRRNANSVHHRLERGMTDGRLGGKPFSNGPPWNSNRLERFRFRSRNKLNFLIDQAFGRTKYATEVRNDFFRHERPNFARIFSAASTAELWRFIDKDVVHRWFLKGRSLKTEDAHMLLRLLPVLVAEVGDD